MCDKTFKQNIELGKQLNAIKTDVSKISENMAVLHQIVFDLASEGKETRKTLNEVVTNQAVTQSHVVDIKKSLVNQNVYIKKNTNFRQGTLGAFAFIAFIGVFFEYVWKAIK